MYDFDEIIDRKNTDCVKYDLVNEIFGKTDIIPMWVADMDFATPPFIIEAIENRLKHPVLGYSVRNKTLYIAIVRWLETRHNWSAQPEWISFCPGVVPGLAASILAFTKPGDKILIQPPVYTPFHSIVKNNFRELVFNPLIIENGNLAIDFPGFIEKIKSGVKLFILCSPHNPGGNVWKRDELEKMAEICFDNHVLVLSDEIHADIVYSPAKHIPFASVSEKALTNSITFISPSKTFNIAGLATSAAIIPDKSIREKYNFIINTLHLNMGNIAGNIALEAAYSEGAEWLNQLLLYLKNNIDFTVDFFKNNIPQIKPFVPEGTYLIWLDCRKTGLSQMELNRLMIEKAGVGMNDGTQFGPGGEGFLRMNIACPKKILEKALNQIVKAIKN